MRIQNPRLSELFKTPQRKTYTMTVITAVTVGVFLLFAIRPTFLRIAQLNREIDEKETFLSQIEQKMEILNSLIRDKQSVSVELETFELSLPLEEKTGFMVANLAEIAKKYNVDLMSIEFERPEGDLQLVVENAEWINSTQVKVNVEGGPSSIQGFVEYLETFPRIIDVDTISYSRMDITDYSQNLDEYREMSCSINFYMYNWLSEQVLADEVAVAE
jgi:Tfp pilus assembly protein PilO